MAKTKAELQYDREQYHAILAKARNAVARRAVQEAVELATSALRYVDGMMQFERRFVDRKEFESIECIDLILKYAPLLFDTETLEQVGALLRSQRRLKKYASVDLDAKLAAARKLMWDAHRLWNLLEKNVTVRQNMLAQLLGGVQDSWWELTDEWVRLGMLSRRPEASSLRLSLATQLTSTARGKCPSCGSWDEAAKCDLLLKRTCSGCQQSVHFVFCDSCDSN